MADNSIPRPQYFLWECVGTAIGLAKRALEEVRTLQRMPGLQGEKGDDGKQGRRGELGPEGPPGPVGREGPAGRDGRAGRDGTDGFSLDDFDVKSDDDGRTFVFAFKREGREPIIREVKTAIVLDRGVYREGSEYAKGDSVTWGGSTFIAQRVTSAKPETAQAADDWRLSVKRGRDGASAYELARKLGYRGTETEWVASLKGLQGLKGEHGMPGRSY